MRRRLPLALDLALLTANLVCLGVVALWAADTLGVGR